MKAMIRLSLVLTLLLGMQLSARPVQAHPLGNFTINHYAGLSFAEGHVAIDFIIDMAEIPAYQEISGRDHNGNQLPDPAEFDGYAAETCQTLADDLQLRLDSRLAALELGAAAVVFPAGQGGLPTLRLNCAYTAAIGGRPATMGVEFADHTYAERLGWREIVVHAPREVLRGVVSTASMTRRLTDYPDNLLANPLDQRQAVFEIDLAALGDASAIEAPLVTTDSRPPVAEESFTGLIQSVPLGAPGLLAALALAALWGAAHALTPGHGKTVVGAYLVGTRGTARHAVYLGLITTLTHTAGVFALGLVMLVASRYVLPERLFPWLSLLSGLLVAGLGVAMLRERLRGGSGLLFGHSHTHGGHPHPHNVDEHSHPDCHPAEHGHGWHVHPHPAHPDHHSAPHSVDAEFPASDDRLSWRRLAALGISGGLLPCPSALVVMLSAIALDRVGFGMALVTAFSLGLAGVLTGIGLVFVYARRWFERAPQAGWVLGWLPAAGAVLVTVAGALIIVRALGEMGVL